MQKKTVTIIAIVIAAGAALFLLLQLVPGPGMTNPPVTGEPPWDSPETRALAKRACYDCHSNESAWPWYAAVAPMKWLVIHDVEEARSVFNFSEWESGSIDGQVLAEAVSSEAMPLPQYLLLHPEARLSAQEKQRLMDGFTATFK